MFGMLEPALVDFYTSHLEEATSFQAWYLLVELSRENWNRWGLVYDN
jgi:hypothetical protein